VCSAPWTKILILPSVCTLLTPTSTRRAGSSSEGAQLLPTADLGCGRGKAASHQSLCESFGFVCKPVFQATAAIQAEYTLEPPARWENDLAGGLRRGKKLRAADNSKLRRTGQVGNRIHRRCEAAGMPTFSGGGSIQARLRLPAGKLTNRLKSILEWWRSVGGWEFRSAEDQKVAHAGRRKRFLKQAQVDGALLRVAL